MARMIDSKCKLCRREGMKLFLKGQRCFTDKCALSRRDYPPGMHAQRRSKVTDFGLHLREKQKLKRIYGVFESQFRRVFSEAARAKGNTGEMLLALLERRLDNVVLSSGFALSRNHARQLVAHGHITVNGRKVDIPSFTLRAGDAISVRKIERSKKIVAQALDVNKSQAVPEWLEVNQAEMLSRLTSLPRREHVPHPIQEQLVVEICSK